MRGWHRPCAGGSAEEARNRERVMAARRRDLLMWLCSFVLAASVLTSYFKIPWMPLCVGGALTLAWTLFRRRD